MANFYYLWEKTLYHGTIIDNEPTIRQYGLVGGWHAPIGKFVSDMYGGEEYGTPSEDDEIVFLADRESLDKAVTAMTFHVAQKLGKGLHDVTDTDIRNHGLLVISKDNEPTRDSWGGVRHKPDEDDGDYDNYPRGVERGDYFASQASADVILRGPALLRALQQRRAWPRKWGPKSPQDMRKIRGRLVALAMKAHPDRTRDQVAAKVNSLSDKEALDYIDWYR